MTVEAFTELLLLVSLVCLMNFPDRCLLTELSLYLPQSNLL